MSQVMLTPEQKIRQRTAWFQAAERLGNVTVACERCGISRKTFYKWRKRFAEARGDRQASWISPASRTTPREKRLPKRDTFGSAQIAGVAPPSIGMIAAVI